MTAAAGCHAPTAAEAVAGRTAGWLANAISPWGLLSASVQTVVHDADETPYCDSSSHPQLDRVLHEEWPHDLLLPAVDAHA